MESIDVRLARIEEKVDMLLKADEADTKVLDRLNERISKLEKFEAKLIGVAVAVSAIISIVIKRWV
jgi:cell division protein FtsL